MKYNLAMAVLECSQDLRDMKSEQSVLTRCDGSATFHQGDSSVMVAVYGPTEVRMNKELIDRAYVDVVYKPKVGLPGCEQRLLESQLRKTCETLILATAHPRTAISIIIQELQNSGSLLACSINTACLALLDAAVPMKYMLAAVSCVITEDGEVQLDPTNKQEKVGLAQLTFAFESKDHSVVTAIARGQYTQEQYMKCLVSCRDATKHIYKFYREAMTRTLSKTHLIADRL